jgi:hypothetical protein
MQRPRRYAAGGGSCVCMEPLGTKSEPTLFSTVAFCKDRSPKDRQGRAMRTCFHVFMVAQSSRNVICCILVKVGVCEFFDVLSIWCSVLFSRSDRVRARRGRSSLGPRCAHDRNMPFQDTFRSALQLNGRRPLGISVQSESAAVQDDIAENKI